MRKFLIVSLSFVLGTLLITGCGSSSTSSSATLPTSTAAASVGSVAYNSIGIDDTIIALPGVSAEASSLKASTTSTPVYGADGWWTSSNTYSAGGISYGYYYKFKIWDNSDTEITSLPASSINKISTYSTLEITSSSSSFVLSYGTSTSNPLIFDNINVGSPTISGPMSYTSTYNSETYETTLTYSSLSLNTSGYPTGEVAYTVSYGGSTVLSGTITYDGTNTATMTYSTTTSSGSYTIDLDTGAIS